MAHKNVSFVLIPKIMRKNMTKLYLASNFGIYENYCRTFWCVEVDRRCRPSSRNAVIRSSSVSWRQQLLTKAKLTPIARFIDESCHWKIVEFFIIIISFILFVKKGSHQCRGAFFTDSNELDPAVMTERSDPKRKLHFFILTVSTGQETVSALSRSPMQCRIGLTSLTARKRCKNCFFLGRSHLAGRCVIWHKSSKICTFFNDFIVDRISWRLCPQPRVQGGEE